MAEEILLPLHGECAGDSSTRETTISLMSKMNVHQNGMRGRAKHQFLVDETFCRMCELHGLVNGNPDSSIMA